MARAKVKVRVEVRVKGHWTLRESIFSLKTSPVPFTSLTLTLH
jgi:hypothetical protein